ncbi:MAG: ABC transporter permease, partial [Gammaproteobacteria bacterium]|nr:ABC transporter permease [Gammaproteobacteria bacterium]
MVEKLKAASLAIPLTAFVVVTFLLPIGGVITQSVYDDTVASVLPRTASALADWDGKILPDEQTFVALGEEIQRAREDRTLGRVASRINRIQTGTRSLLTKTARNIRSTSSDEL